MAKGFKLPTYEQMNAAVREAHALNRSFEPRYVRYRGLLFIAAIAVGATGTYGYQHRRGIIVRAQQGIESIVEKMGHEQLKERVIPMPDPTPPTSQEKPSALDQAIALLQKPDLPKPPTPDERRVKGGRVGAPLPTPVATPSEKEKQLTPIVALQQVRQFGSCYSTPTGFAFVFNENYEVDQKHKPYQAETPYRLVPRRQGVREVFFVMPNRTRMYDQFGVSCQKLEESVYPTRDNATCYAIENGEKLAVEFRDLLDITNRGFRPGQLYTVEDDGRRYAARHTPTAAKTKEETDACFFNLTFDTGAAIRREERGIRPVAAPKEGR